MLEIRKATVEDVHQFVLTIDPMDIDELEASEPHRNLEEVLLSSVDDALVCVDEEGCVFSYGGIVPTPDVGGAIVWFLSSYSLREMSPRSKAKYLRIMRQWRDNTVEKYGSIYNFVWNGNENHKEFIRHLGGTFHDIYRYSPFTAEGFQLFTIGGNS